MCVTAAEAWELVGAVAFDAERLEEMRAHQDFCRNVRPERWERAVSSGVIEAGALRQFAAQCVIGPAVGDG